MVYLWEKESSFRKKSCVFKEILIGSDKYIHGFKKILPGPKMFTENIHTYSRFLYLFRKMKYKFLDYIHKLKIEKLKKSIAVNGPHSSAQ